MKWRSILAACFCFLMVNKPAEGKFAQATLAPIGTLLEKAEKFLKLHPEDASAYYTLGRIHYLAFYNRSQEISAFAYGQDEGLPAIAPYWTTEQSFLYQARNAEAQAQALKKFAAKSVSDLPRENQEAYYKEMTAVNEALVKADWKPEVIDSKDAIKHAEAAYLNFEKAIKLSPDTALYLLGKASLLEQVHSFSQKERSEFVVDGLKNLTRGKILDAYFSAYSAGKGEVEKLETLPIAGLRSVAGYEAAFAFSRLCEGEDLTPQNAERLKEIQSKMESLKKLRRGAITPIIFSMNKGATLDSLISKRGQVFFDLDGDGLRELWPWLQNDTAILVWDPARIGRILSGKQLFGSYTFEMPWGNGYEALAMLDRDDNGELSGGELDGIRVWIDKNSNGVSESGEVMDIEALGITAIATRPEEGEMFHKKGIRLKNGSELKTWDWVPLAGSASE